MKTQVASVAYSARHTVTVFLMGLVCVCLQPLPVSASHIAKMRDVNALRRPMPFEGYLNYQHGTSAGEERTGWTDVRHPALDGTVDNMRGYDWSDNQVVVLTHNVRVDPPAGAPGDTTVTPALRRQDFDVANAVYAQAGIGVRQENNVTILGHNIVNNAAGNAEPSLSTLFGTGRSANASTVNQYYVDDIAGLTRGYALPPAYAARGGFANGGNHTDPPPPGGFPMFNDGFAVSDLTRTQAGAGTSTFAHELGHVLLDTHRFATSQRVALTGNPTGGQFTLTFAGQTTGNIAHNATANTVRMALAALPNIGAGNVNVSGNPGGPWVVRFGGAVMLSALQANGGGLTGGNNPAASVAVIDFHSRAADDLMLATPNHPGLAPKVTDPILGPFGLRQPGQRVGNIGTHSHLGENVISMAGGAPLTQTEAMHRSPFVQEDDNGATHGDRADFDWVEHNIALESAGRNADNHPAAEFMAWEIGAVAGSAHEHNGRDTNFAHQHGAWGELALAAFSF